MSVRFDAASDRIHFAGTLPNPAATGLTIMGWFRLRADRDDFSTYWRTSSGGGTLHTVATSVGGLGCNVFTGSGSLADTYLNVVNEWVHIAVADNNGSVTQYVTPDGGAITLQSGVIGSGTPDQVCIGGRHSGVADEWLNGAAAHVRVFASVLTQAEVEAERDSATAVLTAWADWPLTVHTDLTDHSGNGRNLIAGTTATTTEEGPPLASVVEGQLAAVAPLPTVAMTATVTNSGQLTATAPLPTASLAGAVTNEGQLQATAPLPQATLAATVTNTGQLAATTPLPLITLTGAAPVTGALHGVAPPAVGALAGTVTNPGQIHAVAPAPVAALSDAPMVPWPPTAGAITVRGVATGTLGVLPVATGLVTVI